MRKVSIRVKIITVIVLSLLVTILVILYVSTSNQRENLLLANEKTLTTSTAMLNVTIKSLMLSGEAPLAVQTLEGLQKIQDIEELEIYRTDGSRAFHDYETLETVNMNLKGDVFEKTERIPNRTVDNNAFQEVLATSSPERVELRSTREMEYYFPILNVPECRECHGSDHFIRGIAYFRISTKSVFEQINKATILLSGVFIVAGIIISIILVLFIKRIVISPVLQIGTTVNRVGRGDFDARVPVRSMDELGQLGNEINQMIQGLEERFHLSKYVSKTTENLIRQRRKIEKVGERQNLTVLFSDIRNFTRYSDENPPEKVIEILNKILQAQAEMVEQFQGDVDKFIGDAVMALFTDEYMAVQCAYNMVRAVRNVDRQYNSGLCIGVGVNSGEVILGNIGSETRLEYAVIGDVVNVASRLSGLAKPNMILISETTMKQVEGKVKAKLISDQQIKGKIRSINFYVVQAVQDEKTGRLLR